MRLTTAVAQRAFVGIRFVALTLSATRAHASPIAPLNYFLHAAGPAAAPTMRLGWVMAGVSVTVTAVIAGLLIAAIARKRPTAASDSLNAESGGMRWIYIGTGVSSVALLAMLVYILITLEAVATPATHPQLTISVTAYDWWWKVDYADDPNPARNFSTANEIHIPVGEPVKIALKSADVVHAFWVPQLAGKTQTIPGQTNEQWIQADRAGIYRGQCSQFCGAQHAHMSFEVVAQSPEDFNAWRDAQGKTAVSASDSSVAAGRHLFAERCAGCHTIRGTDVDGRQAPDLTHLNSRRLIAAGVLTNTPDHLLDWIQHAQSIKPESLMPSIALNAGEAAALSAYLATLH
ncbi:cytochrome c oxidase subunit 2 [Paraburkholderia sp. BL6665CI2N2]|uniref:cytochrome c oxidase subunit II n=1 Tax=Paraburkholderia sp. BL6665CI2N2 TaxID=1938806 RepID=UPI0010661131|nr:cytochrome c oxidase subunit II [Paraburkholderia sp. BL6665CI2N2]TDY20805.1 cytochrome c oxidase subunit 2 [Paraburkholderia sp. BL6665CI2N2]